MSDPAPKVEPPRWALSAWARAFRRIAQPWYVSRLVRKCCSPLTVHGEHNLADLKGPAVFIANHSSHFDAYLLTALLPSHLRYRTAMAAAADRWYTRKKWRANWNTLLVNIYPIQRGGGRAALSYSEELLGKGWSLIIFPEGTRAKKGHMEAFKFGVAILALGQGVPVVPFHFKGTAAILPPRERVLRKAPVEATIGAPVTFEPGTSLPDAVAQLQEAVEALAGEPEQPAAVRPSAAA
jgi:1-acyl-sn-glycerol-3-phosphate acyltransferase